MVVCGCKGCGGRYINDLDAIYWGTCVPLGFSNSSLSAAVSEQPPSGMGERFEAFVIPKNCPTMIRTGPADPQYPEIVRDEHTAACCWKHGCRMGSDNCTVVRGVSPQEQPCHLCE